MGQLYAEWLRFDDFCFSGLVYLRRAVLRQVAVLQQPFFVLLRQYRTQKPHDALFVGEDTHHVGTALHFFIQTLQRVGRVDFHPVRFREAEVRQHVLFRFVHHLRDRQVALFQLTGNLAPGGMGAFLVGLHEHLLQRGADHRLVRPADAAQHIAHEVNPAALPTGGEHLLYRRLQTAVRVGDNQLHALQTALLQAQQEGQPERFGF